MALSMRAKIGFARALIADPFVPLPAKVMLFVVVGYLALPFDLIPDFIPVAGQLDDMLLIILGLGALILAVPRDRFEAALGMAEREEQRRRVEQAISVESPRSQ